MKNYQVSAGKGQFVSFNIIHELCTFSNLDINWLKTDEFLFVLGPKRSFLYLHMNTRSWKKIVVILDLAALG